MKIFAVFLLLNFYSCDTTKDSSQTTKENLFNETTVYEAEETDGTVEITGTYSKRSYKDKRIKAFPM